MENNDNFNRIIEINADALIAELNKKKDGKSSNN